MNNKLLPTKKELYELHCKKRKEKAVSFSGFLKRISTLGRTVAKAISTPAMRKEYEPFFACNAKK